MDAGKSSPAPAPKPAPAPAPAPAASAPAAAPSTSAQSASSQTGSVSTSASASATGDVTSASATDSVSIKEGDNNPYSAVAPYSETVTAEAWTKDRTPGEGQVARDDHLEGMLRNRGFSRDEIYKKDENGVSLLDRVTKQNKLKNPNLIQSGGSYVLPSKNEPKSARAEQISQAMAESMDVPAVAEAESKAEIGKGENVKTNEVANAAASSVNDDATATASASTSVNEAETVDANNVAASTAQSLNGDAAAVTSAETAVGKAEKVNATNAAASGATSVNGDASTVASSTTTVGEADEINSRNGALAQSQSTNGKAESNAMTGNLVGKGGNVVLENESKSDAFSSKDEATATGANTTAVGEAETLKQKTKVAAAAISADDTASATAANDSAVNKAGTVITESDVNASATGGEGAAAEAANRDRIGSADKAHIKHTTTATAAKPESDEIGAATNTSEVAVKNGTGIEVEDRASATPDGSASEQKVEVADHDGAYVALDATALGDKSTAAQDVDIAGDGGSHVATTAQAEDVNQRVENHTEDGPHSVPTANDPETIAELDSHSTGGVTNQTAEGVQKVNMETSGAELAIQNSDAVLANYSGKDTGRLNVVHEGRDGTVDVSASGSDSVYFKDGAHNGMMMGLQTGNSITGAVETGNARLDMSKSKAVNLGLRGTDGDDRHEVMLPTTAGDKPNRVASNLGGGDDFFVAKNGNADLNVVKSDGNMNLHVTRGDGGQVATANHVFDAGKGNINGLVDLRNVDKSTVTIRAGEGNHEARIRAGRGESDTIVFEVNGNDAVPNLDHSGFENVVVVRNGKVEVLSGQAPAGLGQ